MARLTKLDRLYEEMWEAEEFARYRVDGVNFVPGEGKVPARILIVGEAPGATENRAGRPFIGASGKVLRQFLTECAEIPEADCFITNVIHWRPAPDHNRNPNLLEIEAARPWLRKEWHAVGKPPVIVTAGASALFAIRPDLHPVSQFVGNPCALKNGGVLFPMYHPAYPLYNAAMRPKAEEHWTRFGEWYREEFPR